MIDPAKDTAVVTPGGATIRIAAGTLTAANASAMVRLEIKEAYVVEDMVKNKLLVASAPDKDPLSSSGILYLNATVDGEAVTISKPLAVEVPTKYPVSGLMVYTGAVDDSSAVSWADPVALEKNPATRQVANGKVIYLTSCASCHTLQGNVTGPPLAWITTRRDRKWLYAFTRNSARMLWRGDAYSCFLFNRYNKRSMEIFPNLSDSALSDLYAYIAVASARIDSSLVPDQKRSFDSCAANDPNCSGAPNKTIALDESGSGDSVSASVSSSASFYGFSVNRWGWYNIAQRKSSETSDSDAVAVNGGGEAASGGPAQLQACPCWCDESAYRRADSVARAHSKPRPRVTIPR